MVRKSRKLSVLTLLFISMYLLFYERPYSCFLQLSKKVSFKSRVLGRLKIGQGCPESIDVLQFMIPKSYSRWDIRKCAGEAKEMVNTTTDFAPCAQPKCLQWWAHHSKDIWPCLKSRNVLESTSICTQLTAQSGWNFQLEIGIAITTTTVSIGLWKNNNFIKKVYPLSPCITV